MMDVSKENVMGPISAPPLTFDNRSRVKSGLKETSKPKKSATKRALADVGNTIHQLKKNAVDLVKNNDLKKKKLTKKTKNINKSSEEKLIPHKIPLSPTVGFKVAANLSPCYFYDSEDEDGHDYCSADPFDDSTDCLLPLNLRLNDDDFDSLTMFKPRVNQQKSCWESNFSVIADGSDFDDMKMPFPSPDKKYIGLDLPFNEFIVPGINLDFSF